MNDVASQSNSGPLGAISRFFPPLPSNAVNSLGAGIQASFAIVGYKGKVWSYRYRGESRPIMRPDGDGPAASLELVILRAPKHLSKIFYKTGYVEGSTAPPDCFSNDAVKPDPSAKELQNPICGTCRWNAWGSRIVTQAGRSSAGKACSDSKRLAVVPLNDLLNADLGGPMLLRVPPASLQDLALYGGALAKYSYPEYAVATRISFDMKEAYPKFLFQAIRALTDEEAKIVIDLQRSDSIERVIAETGEAAEAAEVAEPLQTSSPFEQAPPSVAQGGQATQAPQPQPQQPQKVASEATVPTNGATAGPAQNPPFTTEQEQPQASGGDLEDELDKHLASLLPAA